METEALISLSHQKEQHFLSQQLDLPPFRPEMASKYAAIISNMQVS